jgi:hypothetical protein
VALLLLLGCSDPAASESGATPIAPNQESPAMSQQSLPPNSLPLPLISEDEADRIAFDHAVAANTNAALIFFLARNPQSRFVPSARQSLAVRRSPDAAGVAAEVAKTDADVIEAFDAARLAGTATAWQGFLVRYGSHPLAVEAQFWISK